MNVVVAIEVMHLPLWLEGRESVELDGKQYAVGESVLFDSVGKARQFVRRIACSYQARHGAVIHISLACGGKVEHWAISMFAWNGTIEREVDHCLIHGALSVKDFKAATCKLKLSVSLGVYGWNGRKNVDCSDWLRIPC